jgi:hypothetical protein
MELLASDASAVRAHLLGGGLSFLTKLTTNARLRERFTEYIQTAATRRRDSVSVPERDGPLLDSSQNSGGLARACRPAMQMQLATHPCRVVWIRRATNLDRKRRIGRHPLPQYKFDSTSATGKTTSCLLEALFVAVGVHRDLCGPGGRRSTVLRRSRSCLTMDAVRG